MDVRKYVLDLNNVVRIDVEPLKSDLVRLLITKVNWIKEERKMMQRYLLQILT